MGVGGGLGGLGCGGVFVALLMCCSWCQVVSGVGLGGDGLKDIVVCSKSKAYKLSSVCLTTNTSTISARACESGLIEKEQHSLFLQSTLTLFTVAPHTFAPKQQITNNNNNRLMRQCRRSSSSFRPARPTWPPSWLLQRGSSQPCAQRDVALRWSWWASSRCAVGCGDGGAGRHCM